MFTKLLFFVICDGQNKLECLFQVKFQPRILIESKPKAYSMPSTQAFFLICDGQNKLECLSLARYFSQFK